MQIAFCGGGSGGHLTPAIAVAEAILRQQIDAQITFYISSRQIDERILSSFRWTCPQQVRRIVQPVSGVSGGRIATLAALVRSWWKCSREWKRKRPDVVVGLGGFASVPGLLAAAWLRIPIVLMEQNVVPGRANTFCRRWATVTLAGLPWLPEIQDSWPTPVVTTGVPLAEHWFARSPAGPRGVNEPGVNGPGVNDESGVNELSAQTLHSRGPSNDGHHVRLLILGGSQGAANLNRLVTAALTQLFQSESLLGNLTFDVLHQTGNNDLQTTLDRYQESTRLQALGSDSDAGYLSDNPSTPNVATAATDEIAAGHRFTQRQEGGHRIRVTPFLSSVRSAMQDCDFVISRAGAVTLAEIAVVGRASILVPLATSRDEHQQRNAEYFQNAGACSVIDERHPQAVSELMERIRQQSVDTFFRKSQQTAAAALNVPDAAPLCAKRVLQVGFDTIKQ